MPGATPRYPPEFKREAVRLVRSSPNRSVTRIARELGRVVATGKEAREIYKIGVQYNSVDETLAQLGMVPNREPVRRAVPNRYAA